MLRYKYAIRIARKKKGTFDVESVRQSYFSPIKARSAGRPCTRGRMRPRHGVGGAAGGRGGERGKTIICVAEKVLPLSVSDPPPKTNNSGSALPCVNDRRRGGGGGGGVPARFWRLGDANVC